VSVAHAQSAQSLSFDPAGVESLLERLDALLAGLQELVAIADRKRDALRRADAGTLQTCAATEERVLRRLFRGADAPRAVSACLAQSLRALDPSARSLSDLAARLPEPFGSRIRAKNEALRAVARALREKNQMAARVARALHEHVRSLFADLAKAHQETVVYACNGQPHGATPQAWIDAVG